MSRALHHLLGEREGTERWRERIAVAVGRGGDVTLLLSCQHRGPGAVLGTVLQTEARMLTIWEAM